MRVSLFVAVAAAALALGCSDVPASSDGGGGDAAGGAASGGAASGGAASGGEAGAGGLGSGGSAAGGSLGAGGSAGGGGTPPGDAPLPNHESMYGALADGAFYLFREPYITVTGDPPVITAAVNVDAPGSRDLTFANPPRWLPAGGADGRGAAQFDGDDDCGSATGFSFAIGSHPSILVVLRYDDVSDRISHPVQLHDGTSAPQSFLNAAHIRTMSGDVYRANGSLIGVPHAVEYLTPEGSNDTAPHLHETHAYATGMMAMYDGSAFGPGGANGISGQLVAVHVGCASFGPNGGEHAAAQISEIVITEGRTEAEAAAYRELRVKLEYPSIGLP
jgi:hypothetical protein